MITHSSDLSDKELLEDGSTSELLHDELLVDDLPSKVVSKVFHVIFHPKVLEEKFFSVPARIPLETGENGHLFRALCQNFLYLTFRSAYPKIS
jgi:hypothetical protein